LEAKFDDLLAADDQDEQEAMVAQLRSPRTEIKETDDPAPATFGDDWRQDIITLARDGNIEMSEAKELRSQIGEAESDPDVLETTYETEIKETELEHATSRYDPDRGNFPSVRSRLPTRYIHPLSSPRLR